MAALFGSLAEYDPDKEEWPQYATRLDHFFAANAIKEADKKKDIFLSMLGPQTFKLLSSLVAPAKPGEKTYKDLVAVLQEHYCPEPSEVVQRLQFYARDRKPGENISTYVAELRTLAIHCNFGETLNKMLHDRLVGGINDSCLRRLLLQEKGLDFAKAMQLALNWEATVQNEKALQETDGSDSVRKMDLRPPRRDPKEKTPCYRCGKIGHAATSCRFRTAKCHSCGRVGQLKAVCRGKSHRDVIKRISDETPVKESSEYALYALDAMAGSTPPFTVNILVDNVPLVMELDTGASLTIMPESTFHCHWPDRQLQPTPRKLRTYTGETVEIVGTTYVHVRHGANFADLPLMVVSQEGPCLLGRNWLNSIHLDWNEIHCLHDGVLEEVLHRHSKVFQDDLGTLKDKQVTTIHIDPNVSPKFCRARPVPYSMRPLVEAALDKLVAQGVIEPVQFSDWAAPIVPVLKADKKTVRICGDFSVTINKTARLDRYPIPQVEDLFAKLRGGQSFTKLDLSQAYQQLELDKKSKELAVMNTHWGLFRYNLLPYGVSSAPGIFQRVMESLLQHIPSVVVYLDDILITGSNDTEHLATLDKVLDQLERHGLRVNKSKCSFLATSVVYLGYKLDKEGLHPTHEKVEAIQRAPSPKNITQLKAYLGLLNYYSKFLPKLATVLNPLYSLLRSSTKWRWGSREEAAFQDSKELLLSSQVLVHYSPEQELILACNASDYGLGVVLSHKFPDGQERPIGYHSRTLTPAERIYSQIEKEELACVFAVKRFHNYLFGRSFTLVTNHKPLSTLFASDKCVPTHASARIQRWALTLAMYTYKIKYKCGEAHNNADALSRLPRPHTLSGPTPQPTETVLLFEQLQNSPITADQIKLWTSKNPILSRVLRCVQNGWPAGSVQHELRPYWHKRFELSCYQGCLLLGSRVVVPEVGQKRVLEELHEAHPGISQMKQIARTLVWWFGIDKDIEKTVNTCVECQRHQPLPSSAPVQPWIWPSRPWSRLHADFTGPVQGSMLLIVVDAHSKWIEAHPMSTITSTATAQCLHKIFAVFGIPEVLVTDNGPSFVSEEFEQFLSRNTIKHKTSPPYHPASNGLAERAVQTVKKGLKKMKEGTLQDKLSRFLFRYRNTPQSTTSTTPAELLLGRRMRSPLDIIHPDLRKKVETKQSQMVKCKSRHSRCALEPGDTVFARNFGPRSKITPWLPGQIVLCDGPRSFQIRLQDGGVIRRHLNHVRRRVVTRTPMAEFEWSTSIVNDVATTETQPETQLRQSQTRSHLKQ